MTIHLVDSIGEALAVALEDAPNPREPMPFEAMR
jgi:hypothetical protein